jgi:prepilin-type N-terminal cleavage/methylation domain-containing protein
MFLLHLPTRLSFPSPFSFPSPRKRGSNFGFTLIEIIVTLGIIALIASIGMVLSFDFYRTYAFNSETDIVVSILQKARNQALSNIDLSSSGSPAPHGVKFLSEPERYVIFQGDSYVIREESLDEEIKASPTIFHDEDVSDDEVVFEQLSANADDLSFIIKGTGAQEKTIIINSEGQIDVQ